jgi:hypothetical protein
MTSSDFGNGSPGSGVAGSVVNNDGASLGMTFTPSHDETCLVNVDGQVVSNSNGGAAVQYGLAERRSSKHWGGA